MTIIQKLNWLPEDYTPAADELRGRVVIVTGASEGLGRETSRRLAASGATVVALARTVPRLETLYDEIVDAGGPEPALYPIDFRGATPSDYDDVAERMETAFDRLDGIVHCAAALPQLATVQQGDPRAWAEVFQTNVHAPYLLTRACVGLLRDSAAKHAGAGIVFTSCALGRRGRAYWGAYAASKFALEGFAQVLGDELDAQGVDPNTLVRVCTFDPGPLRTGLRATAYPGEDPAKVPPAGSVSHAYVYLMSPKAAHLHGQALGAP